MVNLGDAVPARLDGYDFRAFSTDPQSLSFDDTESGERFVRWKAPAAGVYRVDLSGSGHALRWELRKGPCRGEGLWAPTSMESRSTAIALAEGEEILVRLYFDPLWVRRWSLAQYHLLIDVDRSEEGHCDDHADNDGDGAIDCQDSECSQTAACSSGLACADVLIGDGALPLTHRTAYTGLAPDLFRPSCAEISRAERVYRWSAPHDGQFAFKSAASATIAVYDGCVGAELACSSQDSPDVCPPCPATAVGLTLRAGQTVLIVLEGTYWDGNLTGIPELLTFIAPDAERTLEDCQDGRDNDGDELPDRYDPSCANFEANCSFEDRYCPSDEPPHP